MQNLDSNQTQFAEITPVFESGSTSVAPKKVQNDEPVKKKSNLPLLVGALALVLAFVFLIILISVKLVMNTNPENNTDDGRIVEQNNGQVDPLLEEIYDLDDQLQSSDPTIDEIPFPPVDMTLRLDAPKKK